MDYRTINRRSFLFYSLKIFALTSVSISGTNCRKHHVDIPSLKILSEAEYLNMVAIQEVFLKDSPISGFDLGKAADDHIAGHPNLIPDHQIVKDLTALPSSKLASIVLDHSLTTLVELSVKEREQRLLSWKHSSNKVKRGFYSILRQFSFYLLSMNKDYQIYAGYTG